MLLLQEKDLSLLHEVKDVVVPLLLIAIGIFTNLSTSKSARAKFEGAADRRFIAVENRVTAIEKDDDKQWSAITNTRTDVANLKGRIEASAKGHHA